MSDPIVHLNAALEGRYHVERQLGLGGMATVYLARDLKHNRSVALKVLKPELAAVVGAERFLAEIETTANLQHPHILPLFDSGEAGAFLFYVMPYVDGESLRDRLDRERQLPVEEAVAIATKVAGALHAAHEQGVIHRDIKPANILLSKGEPLVSDFGIALALGAAGGGRLTETGLSLGTPHYMSPEQATGSPNVGAATDIYALGCVLYEMLAGDPPYTASTPQGILGKIVTGELEPVSKHRTAVPANVESAVAKALEKVAADRFRSAAELGAALADPGFRHGRSGALAGDVSRRSALVGALVAAAVASVITVTVVRGSATRQTAARTPGDTRFSIRLPGVRGSGQQAFDTSPDGRAVYVKVGSQVFTRPLGSLDVTPVRGAEGIGSVFVSADGEWLGFNGPGPVLSRLPVEGGQLTTITEMPENVVGFRGASWGADGTIVFASGNIPGLMRVAASGGVAEPLTTPPAPEVHGAPHFLPGSQHVLFEIVQPDMPTRVAALSMITGEYAVLLEGGDPQYVDGGYVVFQRDNVLWGVRADVANQTVSGDPIAILEGVEASSYANFSVSPNGTLAYAPETTGVVERSLVWVDRGGESVELPVEHRPYGYPRISPSGDRVAVAVADFAAANDPADLWVLDLGRFVASRVTFGGNNRFLPVWTPDGRWLTHADGALDPNRLLRSAADGVGGADTLMTLGSPRRIPGSWSPDGRILALQMGPAGTPTRTRDIFMLDVGGGEPILTEFLVTPGHDWAPTFSPDGRWVAYVSDKSGRNEIYVTPYPGPGPESTISTDGGSEPVWSRDGTQLFYRTPTDLRVVDVGPGERFRAGPPRVLFEDGYERNPTGGAVQPNYDVAADGRFIMVRAVGTAEAGGLVIVQNWGQELRELIGS